MPSLTVFNFTRQLHILLNNILQPWQKKKLKKHTNARIVPIIVFNNRL